MPRDAPVSKVAAVRAPGRARAPRGRLRRGGRSRSPRRARRSSGAALVHPFDDLDVIAGQATLGLELLEDVPDLARVVVPVGGGGLASGIGLALRQARRRRASSSACRRAPCAPYASALEQEGPLGELAVAAGATIADGIALKRPGKITLPLLRELLRRTAHGHRGRDRRRDGVPRRARQARRRGRRRGRRGGPDERAPAAGRGHAPSRSSPAATSTAGCFGALLRRRETEEGRRVRLLTRVPDRPGGLAELLGLVAAARAQPRQRSSTCARRPAARARDGRRAHARDARPRAHPRARAQALAAGGLRGLRRVGRRLCRRLG